MTPRSRHAAARGGADDVARPGEAATIDLHTHTRRSDGLLEPADLVSAAAEAGVRLLAITDHDNLAGYRELVAGPDALPAGLDLVPGVEINAIVESRMGLAERELHVLGLGVDPDDARFETLLAGQRAGRRIRFDRMVRRLLDAGLDVREALERLGVDPVGAAADPSGATDDDALGRPTVARALVAIGAVATVQEAFDRYLSPEMPGYVARDGIGLLGAIDAIRAAGGLAVLAHFWGAADHPGIVTELVDEGLRGIEAHHVSFDESTVAAITDLASRLRLVTTGGTDYHGDVGTYAEAHARLAIPSDVAPRVRAALAR